MTSTRVNNVSSSRPFATLTIIWSFTTHSFINLAVLRTYLEGTAIIRKSLPSMASSISGVILISSCTLTPGNFGLFSLVCFNMSISFWSMDQIVTSCPFSYSSIARAVPQLPAPITETFFHKNHLAYICIHSMLYSELDFFLCPNLFSSPRSSLLILALCVYRADTISTHPRTMYCH